MQNQQITKRIKLLCRGNHVTAKAMLGEIGLNKNFMYDLNKGNKSPTVRNLTKIAEYFDCSLDYLTGRTDNPSSHRS